MQSDVEDALQLAQAHVIGSENAGWEDDPQAIVEPELAEAEMQLPEPPAQPSYNGSPVPPAPPGSPFGEPPSAIHNQPNRLASIVSAPVSREASSFSYTPSRPTLGKIRLTKEEVDIAQMSGLSLEEYARGKLRLEQEKMDDPYRFQHG
jgi:hypothetical protein